MQWGNILIAEVLFILLVIAVFRLVKFPGFLKRRKLLVHGFPWGYYTDALPKADSAYSSETPNDFLHDTAIAYEGVKGFGDFGEFSGFGQMGEFSSNTGAGGGGGHEG